jgi:hypothetical protein
LPHFEGSPIRLGESLTVIGSPLRGLLASGPHVTTGVASSLSGLGDDSREFQISAPVQPGNSGGPVLDQSGSVVGIVTSTLNAAEVQKVTGDIPQNVNFSIKAAAARIFLETNGISVQTASSPSRLDVPSIVKRGLGFTALVECWR